MKAVIDNTEKFSIMDIKASAYSIPTSKGESDGTLKWNSTTLVLVDVKAGGKAGIGYTYADAAAAYFIEHSLKERVTGKNAMDIEAITKDLIHYTRNDSNTGLVMMAISAIDNALWDLKAKLFNVPLCVLLGQVRTEMPIYYSGGFTSYSNKELHQQLSGWAEEGAVQVKIKIGREPEKDVERINVARKAIGTNRQLFVDANGGYTVKQAIENAKQFEEQDIRWFEEPVVANDLEGLNFIRQHAAMNIAAGEYGDGLFYFKQMLDANAVDVLQADATRCGGISGFLKCASLAEVFYIPFSSHCAPALHLHAALAVPGFFTAEYFYDHYRIERLLFDGTVIPDKGRMKPDLSRPGIGIEFKYQDAEQFKI